MKQILTFFIGITCLFSFSQVTEDFSDGDFTQNPIWSGDDSLFVIDAGMLRSKDKVGGRTYCLSTPSTTVLNAQWEFFMNLKFDPSSANYVDVFLTADNANLKSVQNGYFIRVGGTKDEVVLYKLVAGDTSTLINGPDKMIESSSNNPIKIKVTRDVSNLWVLNIDDGITGSYANIGSVTDNSLSTSVAFGIRIVQSTAGAPIENHFFDDFTVGPIVLDTQAPSIISTTVKSTTSVDVLFSEALEQTSAETNGNYSLSPTNTLISAVLDAVNKSLVHLTYTTAFGDGVTQNLTVNNISDLASNISGTLQSSFTYFAPVTAKAGDIIITEFMCDPDPRVGLPTTDFVEIYNTSTNTITLNKWIIKDAAGSGTLASATIAPGAYKVLCPTSYVDSFPNSIGVTSFPNFNNSGDNIILLDSNLVRIDSLTYDQTWYQDNAKSDGGYTIEMINPLGACSGTNNWKASIDPSGGTPGAQNSVYNTSPDTDLPTIVSVEILPPNFISITFSEKMDSLSLANSNMTIDPNLIVQNRFITESYPSSILLELNSDIVESVVYTITLADVADCSQNVTTLIDQFVIATPAQVGDLVINEILSDPVTGGSDFIELRNNSTKLIGIKDLELANFSNDTIANNKVITVNYVLAPNDYVVLTPDSSFQKNQYPSSVAGKFIQMSLPTYSNDSGTVYLLMGSTVLDRVAYRPDWPFELLNSNDGKSLEKINPTGSSTDKSNWHTAAETYNFATPGHANSQLMYGEDQGVLSLTKDIFSPDNDGIDDVLQVNYNMLSAGMVADAKIYDDRGRLIKAILRAELIGSKGQFTWNGVTDQTQKASIGTYILVFEAFDASGTKFVKRLPFVLAGKF